MRLAAHDAGAAILSGRAPAGLAVEGTVDLRGVTDGFTIPPQLRVAGSLIVSGTLVDYLPDGLSVSGAIIADRCPRLVRVGHIAKAGQLSLRQCTALTEIAGPLDVPELLFAGCLSLAALPAIRCSELDLTGCTALTELPARFYARRLDVSGCRRLRTAPTSRQTDRLIVDEASGFPYDWRRMEVRYDAVAHWIAARRARSGLRTSSLALINQTWVRDLPAALHVDLDLNLEGCANLAALPAQLHVGRKLTLTGCRSLAPPAALRAPQVIMPDGTSATGQAGKVGFFRAARTLIEVAAALGSVLPSVAPPPHALDEAEARRAIVEGRVGVVTRKDLTLHNLADLTSLPAQLWVFGNLTLSNLAGLTHLPSDLRVTGAIRIEGCLALRRLPALSTQWIHLKGCPSIAELPPMIANSVTIEQCAGLTQIGPAIATDHLSIRSCPNVGRIADGLPCQTLVLEDLPALTRLPAPSPATTNYHLIGLRGVAGPVTLPEHVEKIAIRDVPAFSALTDGLELRSLEIADCPAFTTLPAALNVTGDLTLRRCPVAAIPADTRATGFSARDMPALESIQAVWRDLSAFRVGACPRLTVLPSTLESVRDVFEVEGCVAITSLPPRLRVAKSMNLAGCTSLRALPPGMPPPERLEMEHCALEGVPTGWTGVALTWRHMAMTERALFRTATMSVEEILAEPNVEVRRVLIERYGVARLAAAGGDVLDADTDKGGGRRLLRVSVGHHEPFVMLEVHCPSTGRQFHLRVPPHLSSCREAAAWTAGYDRVQDYNPVVET